MADLMRIAKEIREHRVQEIQEYKRLEAKARVSCSMNGRLETYFVIGRENIGSPLPALGIDNNNFPSVYKNTQLGRILTSQFGESTFCAPAGKRTVKVLNRTSYTTEGMPTLAREIVYADADNKLRYQNLHTFELAVEQNREGIRRQEEETDSLQEEIREEQERQRAIEEELRLAREAEERERLRRELEEQERRLREKQRQKEEGLKLIESLKQEQVRLQAQANAVRAFIRRGAELRAQPFVDEFQDKAKCEHIYDGVPVIIEGGPGTGKTTTAIQRLKFLLSREALEDHQDFHSLKPNEIIELTNPENVNKNWYYFSPNDHLLAYIRNNIMHEGLVPDQNNTYTPDVFRRKVMGVSGYKFYGEGKPFRHYSNGGVLVQKPLELIATFEKYVKDQIAKKLKSVLDVSTDGLLCRPDADAIKKQCQEVENIQKLEDIIIKVARLYDNNHECIDRNREKLKKIFDAELGGILVYVKQDKERFNQVMNLVNGLGGQSSTDDDEDNEDFPDGDATGKNPDGIILNAIKSILVKIGMREIDASVLLKDYESEIYKLISEQLEEKQDVITEVGKRNYFDKKFAAVCRGLTSNVLTKIPQYYKSFRKKALAENSDLYNHGLLETLIANDNRQIHADEQNLLLGFINSVIKIIYSKTPSHRSHVEKHDYVKGFQKYCRPVIGVDEATDYTVLDYYCIASFRKDGRSCITLCGDIMQGINANGIKQWDALDIPSVLPNFHKYTLEISYRQIPGLLNVASKIYSGFMGEPAPYHSYLDPSENEPLPLCMVSDDENEKMEWIAERMKDVYRAYDGVLPSVAIFVGDDQNAGDFARNLQNQDAIMDIGIRVVDATGGNTGSPDDIRVYRLKDIKGMEFEVAFFYDLDRSTKDLSEELVQKNLYVGFSRATTHLAILLSQKNGYENIIENFLDDPSCWAIPDGIGDSDETVG